MFSRVAGSKVPIGAHWSLVLLVSLEQPRLPALDADALGVPAVIAFLQVVKRQPEPAGVFYYSLLASAAAMFRAHCVRSQSSWERRPTSSSVRSSLFHMACMARLSSRLAGFRGRRTSWRAVQDA